MKRDDNLDNMVCRNCGYEWHSHNAGRPVPGDPPRCPRCHRYTAREKYPLRSRITGHSGIQP